jgi:hypothetical protein
MSLILRVSSGLTKGTGLEEARRREPFHLHIGKPCSSQFLVGVLMREWRAQENAQKLLQLIRRLEVNAKECGLWRKLLLVFVLLCITARAV